MEFVGEQSSWRVWSGDPRATVRSEVVRRGAVSMMGGERLKEV